MSKITIEGYFSSARPPIYYRRSSDPNKPLSEPHPLKKVPGGLVSSTKQVAAKLRAHIANTRKLGVLVNHGQHPLEPNTFSVITRFRTQKPTPYFRIFLDFEGKDKTVKNILSDLRRIISGIEIKRNIVRPVVGDTSIKNPYLRYCALQYAVGATLYNYVLVFKVDGQIKLVVTLGFLNPLLTKVITPDKNSNIDDLIIKSLYSPFLAAQTPKAFKAFEDRLVAREDKIHRQYSRCLDRSKEIILDFRGLLNRGHPFSFSVNNPKQLGRCSVVNVDGYEHSYLLPMKVDENVTHVIGTW